MKNFILLLIAVTVLSSCTYNQFPAANKSPTPEVRTDNRALTGFKKVNVANNFAVEITIGPEFNVSVEGEEKMIEMVATTVGEDTLNIGLKEKFSGNTKVPVKVTMPLLTELEVSGRSTAVVNGATGDSVRLQANGATNIKISGEIKTLDAHAYGASIIDAEGLKTTRAEVEAVGATNVTVSPSATLRVLSAGIAKVFYTGDPKVEKTSSDSSTVTKKE